MISYPMPFAHDDLVEKVTSIFDEENNDKRGTEEIKLGDIVL